MDLGGKVRYSHKYAGIKGSVFCFASFSSPTKTTAHTVWHRQQNSSSLHQQIRENPFTSSDICSLRDVEFCSTDRKLTLSVVYVPGEENLIADKKSRVFQDSLEWMLHPAVFQALQKEAGCFDIDLFATHVNHQVPAFVSWRPAPGAVAIQCKMGFSTGLSIPSLLYDQKMSLKDSTESVTLCSDHTNVEKQTLVSSHSVSLGRATMASSKTTGPSKISRHQKDTSPLSSKNFRLAAWPISGRLSQKKDFHRKSQISFSPLGERKLPVSMKVPGRHGIAGVLSGRLILFQPL